MVRSLLNRQLPALMLVVGLLLLVVSAEVQTPERSMRSSSNATARSAMTTAATGGHREFAWLLTAIEVLSATVKAWTASHDRTIPQDARDLQLKKFNESLEALPALSQELLGMREIFVIPGSFIAFELNDIDRAIEVFRTGSSDPRIEADVALSIAYLSHIFKADLKTVAADYERLLVHFPNASWLPGYIAMLKMGIDPLKRPGHNRAATCKMMSRAFPLNIDRLVERGICSSQILFDGEVK